MRTIWLVVLLGACSPVAPEASVTSVEAGSPWKTTCSAGWTDGPVMVTSYNASFATETPELAMQTARAAVQALEGEVQYSSASADSGSLTARLPAGTPANALLERIEGRLTSESTSSSDYGTYLRQLCGRLDTLERADAAIAARAGSEHGEVLVLERELVERERQNVASQIQSYRDQVGHVQVSLSFSRGY
jgi:hypothetical protein